MGARCTVLCASNTRALLIELCVTLWFNLEMIEPAKRTATYILFAVGGLESVRAKSLSFTSPSQSLSAATAGYTV